VVGVFIMYPLMEFLRVLPEIRMLIFAAIVVIILLFMPEGIAVFIRDKIERQCPRCKLSNVWWRKTCRACSTELR
jgi:branched-chain amino acid transport system permease protein